MPTLVCHQSTLSVVIGEHTECMFYVDPEQLGPMMVCKVDQTRDKYELIKLDQRLKQRYSREDTGLRDLETFINRSVLRRAFQIAGQSVVEGEAENIYRLLTSDEVATTEQEEAKAQLKQSGVDVDEVLKDMVSYQTVRKHLNNCLGIDTSNNYSPNLDADQEEMKKLAGRTGAVAEQTVEKLRRHDIAKIGSPTVTVDIRLRCDECNRSHDLIEFLRRPVCSCQLSDETESVGSHLS